jgi:hypothetical protein
MQQVVALEPGEEEEEDEGGPQDAVWGSGVSCSMSRLVEESDDEGDVPAAVE